MPFYPKRRKIVRKRVYKRRVVKSGSFAKKVQSIINKNAENKQIYTNSFINFNSGINSAGDIQQVVANLGNGTGDYQRIGDQIRAQKLQVKGWMAMTLSYLTSASASRIGVRLMIVQPKFYGGLTEIAANTGNWLGTLLKKGGTTTGFSGAVSDLQSPINTDAITKYYDRVFYLNLPYSQTAVGEASTVGSTRFFSMSKNLRNKLMKYDSSVGSGLTSTQFNPVLLCGYVHLDGSAADVVNTQIQLNYDAMLQFQDI